MCLLLTLQQIRAMCVMMWRIYSVANWLEQSCPIASTVLNPAYKVWGWVLHKMKSANVYWVLTLCARHFAGLASCCGEYWKQKWSLQATNVHSNWRSCYRYIKDVVERILNWGGGGESWEFWILAQVLPISIWSLGKITSLLGSRFIKRELDYIISKTFWALVHKQMC